MASLPISRPWAVASCERDAGRLAELRRHADLVLTDAVREVRSASDLADVRRRHGAFERTARAEPAATGDAEAA